MVNEHLKSNILEIVENQLKNNDPKCTKDTFERLISEGVSEKEAKEMIGAIVVEEIYDVMKQKEPFNEERYCNKLSKLSNGVEDDIQKLSVRSVKIGRNAPCPCGSGKKYKKCCGK